MHLLLASASPRRRQLLADAGYVCDVHPVDVDETRRSGEDPRQYVARIATLKAETALARVGRRVIVAADTAVVVDGDVFGKPADAVGATRMLERLSGRSHEVLTGLAVHTRRLDVVVEATTVWFDQLSAGDVAWYVASGEPMDKAGAYAIQGLAARFIPRIAGSYSNVVGLPIAALARLLAQVRERPAS